MVTDVRMTGCKPVLLHVCAMRCASGLSAALSPAGNILQRPKQNICRLRRGERRAATRLVAGPEPLSSGMEWAREQVLMARVHSISEKFMEKNSEISSGRGGFLGSHEHYN